jgi:ribosomal protein L32
MAGKGLKDVTELNKCSACGHVKRAHLLCPYCVKGKIKAACCFGRRDNADHIFYRDPRHVQGDDEEGIWDDWDDQV